MLNPEQIVFEKMLPDDHYSKWLGIEVIKISEGYAKIEMTIRKDMLNGFGIAHGGITFGFADSAFAFASNSRGRIAYSIETSINHLEKLKLGDKIEAETEEEFVNDKLAKYKVTIRNKHQKTVAIFNGMVYRTSKEWT